VNKQLSILILFILILAVPVTAFDYIWGGELNLNGEAPELQGTVFAAASTDSLNLWFSGRWNDLVNLDMDASLISESDYRFGVAIDTQELGYFGDDRVLYPEISSFNIFGSYGSCYYRAGRQLLSDPAALIVSHPVDGILLGTQLGASSLDLQLGYSGLVNENASTLTLSVNDLAGDHNAEFGAPRLIEKLNWSYPGLYEQSLSLSFLAQQDLHQSGDMVEGSEKLDSQYLELVLKGFLLPELAYKLSGVGETGSYGGSSIMAGVGRLEFSYFPANNNSSLGLDCLYSSGDSWDRVDYYASGMETDVDTLSQYMPISAVSGQGYVEVFELGNISTIGAFFRVSPGEVFSAELRGTTFFRTKPGPVSSTLILNDDNDDSFIGQEGLISLVLEPASDVRFAFRSAVLYMGDLITIVDELEEYFPVLFRLGLDFSLKF